MRLAILAAAFLGVAACAADQQDEPLVLGLVGPLERVYGVATQQGAELARQQINSNGGINGRTLEIRYMDDDVNPQQAIRIAETLYDQPDVVAIVGNVNSGTLIAASAIYQRGIVALSTSATSPKVSHLGEWVFRVAPSDSALVEALAKFAYARGPRTAVLYANDDYGRGLARYYSRAFEALGGQITTRDPYLETMEDFSPYLERLSRHDVTTILVAGVDDGASHLIPQARRMGIDAHFLGGDGLEALVDMGSDYDGILIGQYFHAETSEKARKFADDFQAMFGREASSTAATAFDAVMVLADAMRAGNTTRASIQRHLARLGQPGGAPAHEGVTGTIRFDKNGDPEDKAMAIAVTRNGRLDLVTGDH
jgi:branched-chain amino acid transport system substrate-binding protein